MTNSASTPLFYAFKELKDCVAYINSASYQNIDDGFQRFDHLLRPEGPIGRVLDGLLPHPDYDEWHKNIILTEGGMVGSAKLHWPADIAERVALQRELIHRIADGSIDILDFAHTFTYVDNYHNSNIGAFVQRVFLPFYNDLVRICHPVLDAENAAAETQQTDGGTTEPLPYHFIDPRRLEELAQIKSSNYDIQKVIQFCREIDLCFRNECLLAVAALTRALLDHVPPIFQMRTFSEVANNYSGTKSFRESMQHLENSARKIGDAHLHTQIRKRESIPTRTQVNFANDLDVLLGEIIRVLS